MPIRPVEIMEKHTYDPDKDGLIALAQLVAAVCSETEADEKITTHKDDASAHHAKTTSISDLTDHDKAAHDALNIDADTVDGAHKANLEGTMDSKINTHKGDASAHHAKTTSASELTSGVLPSIDRLPALPTDKFWKGVANRPAEADVPITSGLAVFGDGSDGDITISSNTTLTRDMFYNSLTISNGVILNTGGYRIFVRETLTNNGTIERNGNNGTNGVASTGTAGVGGAALAAGSLGGSGAGGNGVCCGVDRDASGGGGGGGGVVFISARIIENSSGTISANGGNAGNPDKGTVAASDIAGNPGSDVSPSLGGNGGKGGNSSNRTGGAAGTATAPTAAMGGFRALPSASIFKEIETTVNKIGGGGGGGGGAGGEGGAGNMGGSGGGGGGVLLLIYNSLSAGTETANGGAKSNGLDTTENGVDGATGKVIKIANA